MGNEITLIFIVLNFVGGFCLGCIFTLLIGKSVDLAVNQISLSKLNQEKEK